MRQEAAVLFSHWLYIFVGLFENTTLPTQMARGFFLSVPHSALLFSAQNVLLQSQLKRMKKKKKLTVLILAATFQPALLKRSLGTANYSGRREWAEGGGHINPFGSISKPLLTVTCFLFVCVICFLCVLVANRQTDATRGQNQNEILRSVGARACGQMRRAPQPGAFCPRL